MVILNAGLMKLSFKLNVYNLNAYLAKYYYLFQFQNDAPQLLGVNLARRLLLGVKLNIKLM